MATALEAIDKQQNRWAANVYRDPKYPMYVRALSENLFLKELLPLTEAEFRQGDGSELKDAERRPAKMRALVSSSALAVNFFDPWREGNLAVLGSMLALTSDIISFRFEHKPKNYPVKPRSPNLDLVLTLANNERVGVESKFAEPYRSPGEGGMISARYFPANVELWKEIGLGASQVIANSMSPKWHHLDVAQLLKHLLGLAHDDPPAAQLLYLWYDVDSPDGSLHRNEISRFAELVQNDRVRFSALSYQEAFTRLRVDQEPHAHWYSYMKARYFL